MRKILMLFAAGAVLFQTSCKRDKEDEPAKEPEKVNTLPEFYKANTAEKYGKTEPLIFLVADGNARIAFPQDLDYNPTRPNELWILNKGTEATGGSTVMLTNAGASNQQFDFRQDGNAWHFMSLPTALAFNEDGNWATSNGVLDANHQGGTYTGPTLWSGNLNIYARPSGGNGSHLDMLHGSPLGMGIASETKNAFWLFDGFHKHLCRYDFKVDHGPGNDDHSDAHVSRYTDVVLTRNPGGMPSHLAFDSKKEWLYIVDGGKKRILRVNIKTGSVKGSLPLINEELAVHNEIVGTLTQEMVSTGLSSPCGIEVSGNRLFVSDHATGEIICYDIDTRLELARINTGNPGITGIRVWKGKLWFVNEKTHAVYRVDQR